MLETPHVVVGAAIAAKIANPWLSIPLAFGSHFVLDKVPHWNPHLNTETQKHGAPTKKTTLIVASDVLAALIAGFSIASTALPDTTHTFWILVASFVSVSPDVIEGPYFFLNFRNSAFIKKWIRFQKSIQEDTSFVPGILVQVVTVLAAFLWVFS